MEKMMEPSSSDLNEITIQDMNPAKSSKLGGFRTIPFIIANEAFEKVASYGLAPNMILYLMRDYHMGLAKGANILFYWSAATNFLPFVGALLSDVCLGRFLTIVFGCIFSLLGMLLLWLTAMVPGSKPPPCDQFAEKNCESPTSSQMAFLLSALFLMSIGAGGVRSCSLAFGADQFWRKDNVNNESLLEKFFGWYYAAASVAVVVAFTGIVYIQDNIGWKVGFGVPAILMIISTLSFLIASSIYVKAKPNKSMFTGIARAAAAAYKNRKLPLPSQNSLVTYYNKDSETVAPTDKLSFLNKACVIRNPEQEIAPDGSASNPWELCTVGQVEELKALIKVFPIWSTGLLMSICITQHAFPLLQATSMDRQLTSGFKIPAASFTLFAVIALAVWLGLYERVVIPLASKVRGKSVRLSTKQRMGIGIFISTMSMTVSGIVEHFRRRKAIQQGFINNPKAVVDMSALWLVPQHSLLGLAEAFNAIGQIEFYYSEFPKSMSSIAASLLGLGVAFANLLSSGILSSVDKFTSKGGKESWVSSNINKGRYDYYYWILAGISFVNLLFYMVCSWAYGPCADETFKVGDDQSCPREQELPEQSRNEINKDEGKVSEEEGGELLKTQESAA